MNLKKIKSFLFKNRFVLIFLGILTAGMFLRFYRIGETQNFGWDQARDAWRVRDIIVKHIWVLNGPRTGVGHFELGPLWFYLLVPFYWLTGLDPMGANYLNIIVNIFNFVAIFWVTKKIYDNYAASFVTLIYATSRYLFEINRVSWNVSPVPGVAALIFYGIYQVVLKKNYRFVPVVAFLTGLFFHLHFAIVFLPFIIILSFVFAHDKIKVIKYGLLSLPLFLIWFIPTVLYDLQTKGSNLNTFNSFLKYYFIPGFHLRFFIYRLHDAFIQFQMILSLPNIKVLEYIIPAVFFVLVIFEKDKKQRLLGYLISLWFLVPAVGYTFYAGSTSEYYMLLNAPMVLYVLVYLQRKLLKLKFRPIVLTLLTAVWAFFIYYNTAYVLTHPKNEGLLKQEKEVRESIKNGDKIGFNEGDIKAYLYQIWVDDKKGKY